MAESVRVGLLGCGVVGGGVVEAIYQNQDYIERQSGAHLEIVRVAVRNLSRPRTEHVKPEWLCTDWRQITEADDVDIVIEAIGGVDPCKDAIRSALSAGKDVVTANKELLALHGEELYQFARDHGRSLFFEASVLGGVPVLHALQTYFCANRLQSLQAIVNGTSNYILTQMEQKDMPFAQALLNAQEAGYAEPDPASDVEGFDAVFKLQILSRFALGAHLNLVDIPRQGILDVEPMDLRLARNLRCRIKHVVEAEIHDGNVVRAIAAPMFVSENHPLFGIEGVQNALCVQGDIVGQLLFAGPGAGAFPTASAVIEDIIKVIRAPQDALTTAKPHRVEEMYGSSFVARCMYSSRENVSEEALSCQLDVESITDVSVPEVNAAAWVVRGGSFSARACEEALQSLGAKSIRVYPIRTGASGHTSIGLNPSVSSNRLENKQKRNALAHSVVNL